MKVLLYTEAQKTIGKSGLGMAIEHQRQALEQNGFSYTMNPKDDYDMIHVNFYGPKSYFMARKAHKKGKKVIYHAHSTEEDFRNSFVFSNQVAPLFKKWICKCYRLGDHIITPTPYSKRLLENYHLNRPITAISNGIDVSFFERNAKTEEGILKFRNTYGYTMKDKVIVSIGLYIERKGILDFVELARRLPEYQFIWFGYSPLSASPSKIREAVETKLPNLCFAGFGDRDMIRNALLGCDLFIAPTLEETEGITIIEALGAKQNVLIRDIPVFDDWLEDGKNVYKAKDVDEFEIKIKQILEHQLPPLIEPGYEVAFTRDIKRIGEALIDVYKTVYKEEK